MELLSTWEVWRPLKGRELHSAPPRATLTPLSSSPNFPRAQYLDIRKLTHELIVNYYVEQVRIEKMKRAFPISGALIRNGISLSIKTLKKNQFKSKLKRKLFEILEKEDDYIGVSDITGQTSQKFRFHE